MGKIHILPPDVVSKIAAGEVIERPASVVKELLENALDAGSTALEIAVTDAGRTTIAVKDNGAGIAADDIEKIFIRHSTSKISGTGDLYRIATLGFRGEALYSIAAVADVLLRSKTDGAENGWEICCRAHTQIYLKPVPMTTGTAITVRELFFNTPARRKFLKSDAGEFMQILNTVIPYALLYPAARFHLAHNSKTVIDLAPASSHIGRCAGALNLDAESIIEARHAAPEKHSALHLLLGDINIQRRRKDLQFLFVNNRPVQNRTLAFHIRDAYKKIMPDDAEPFFAAFITVPADDVDVNVHPAKREVKIGDERSLGSFLRHLCEQTLLRHSRALQAKPRVFLTDRGTLPHPRADQPAPPSAGEDEIRFISDASGKPYQARFDEFPPSQSRESIPAEIKRSLPLTQTLAGASYAGAFLKKYLLFETPESLLIIDQHAAHERITYEKLMAQIERGKIEIQNLLTPFLVRLTRQELISWEEAQQMMEGIGFSASLWDNETLAIHSHPQVIVNPEEAVRTILDGGKLARADRGEIARRACRQAVMTGDTVRPQEADYLRKALLACEDPLICPHGRPTVIEISEKAISKQFLR